MSRSGRALLVGVLAAFTAPAMAADMPGQLPPRFDPLPPTIINVVSGWYVRGDLGYAWGQMGGVDSPVGFASPSENKLGGNVFGGVGAGIKTKWARTDVTLEYMGPLKYQGTTLASGDTGAKVSAFSALFNGYLDLGTWYRATPYIGAAAGMSQVRVYDFESPVVPFSSGNSHAEWKFTWAAMTGVGYAVAPNVVVDLGYRYIAFGNVTTASDVAGATTLKNIAAHEVRVGVRWSFDDLAFTR